MLQNNKKTIHYCILGLGVTGISCLNFLLAKDNIKITATDAKDTLELQLIAEKLPQVDFFLGNLHIPDNVDFLILSPGISKSLPIINNAVSYGAKLTSDINLFLKEINTLKKSRRVQVVAVTGTNGKTTVVNILAEMAIKSKIKHALCGNVGYPVLDTLYDKDIDLYIIELSSFQLEIIEDLYCDVACILNITPDHLDRYLDFNEYCVTKAKICKNAKKIVYYREDVNLLAQVSSLSDKLSIDENTSFGIKANQQKQGFSLNEDRSWLMKGEKKIFPTNQLALLGEHNILNVLACFCIGELIGLTYDNMCYVLRNFSGLKHRCEIVGKFYDDILWINDSKGTNVGATIAALISFSSYISNKKKAIIILGGISKNADLSILKPFIVNYCKGAILIGESKNQLFALLKDNINCYIAESLDFAVIKAKQIATSGDLVLFSPACSSFDMFKDYKDRGESFKRIVLELYNTYEYRK